MEHEPPVGVVVSMFSVSERKPTLVAAITGASDNSVSRRAKARGASDRLNAGVTT